jgi:acetyltransferase-like isoleucine patch superfamily enzyme
MPEKSITGLKNRILQQLAMSAPGGFGLRVALHRLRGVHIGKGVWIGYGALIETAYPNMVTIGDLVIGIRSTILAHFQEITGVKINDDVYIGACAVILPGVTIGEGAVISAGSVVTASVPPMTVMQGNPAKRVATCGIPLGLNTSRVEFMRHLKSLDERDKRRNL